MIRTLRIRGVLLAALTALAACGGGGADAPDTVAPAVTYVTPSSNAASVGTNSRLTVTFSEPMSEATLAAAISLADVQTGAPVALGSVAYDAANRIATVAPQQPLAPSREYRATVSPAARDSSGNALGNAYAWTFGTAAGADTTPPSVSSQSPADGATDVEPNARIAMSFSEPMDVASVAGAFVLTQGTVAVPGRLDYIGQAAVFTPDAPLSRQATYVATLRRTATDLAGNALAADHVWTFTTGAAAADTTPPSVLAVTPAPNSTAVPRDALLSVTFNEPIFPFVYGTIDGVVVAVEIDYSTNTVTVRPNQPLRSNGGYVAGIQAMDLARNLMAPYQWTFVTAP